MKKEFTNVDLIGTVGTGYSAQGFALGVVVSGGDGVPVNLAMPSMRGSQ